MSDESKVAVDELANLRIVLARADDECAVLKKERDTLRRTMTRALSRASKGGRTFGALGKLLVDELGEAISSAVTMRDALEKAYYWAQQERVAVDRIDEYEADMVAARAALAINLPRADPKKNE